MTTSGTYVSVQYSPETQKALKAWLIKNQVPNRISSKKIHTTVVYSEKPLQWNTLGKLDPLVLIDSEACSFDIWDTEDGKTLVCRVDSPFLNERYQTALELGYEPAFPSFNPHITLSYDVGQPIDLSKLKPISFPLAMIEERCVPLIKDWKLSRSTL